MRKITIVGLALLAAACGDSANVRKVKAEIAHQLRDPESARWTNIREYGGTVVCGEVNGRNAFGAYAGAQKFYGVVTGDQVIAQLVPPDGSSDYCAMYEQAQQQQRLNSNTQ